MDKTAFAAWSESEDGKKILAPYVDRKVSEGIATFKSNHPLSADLTERLDRLETALAAIEGHRRIEAVIKSMTTRGVTEATVEQARQEGLNALRADIFRLNREEAERLDVELRKEREIYEADRRKRRDEVKAEIEAHAAYFAAATTDELRAAALAYLGDSEAAWEPERVDLLSATLKNSSLDAEYVQLRAAAVSRDYRAPWAVAGRGAQIKREAELYRNCGVDETVIRVNGRDIVALVGDVWNE